MVTTSGRSLCFCLMPDLMVEVFIHEFVNLAASHLESMSATTTGCTQWKIFTGRWVGQGSY